MPENNESNGSDESTEGMNSPRFRQLVLAAGLIVPFSIKAKGAKHYSRTILDHEHDPDNDLERKRYETTATTTNVVERKDAERICSWARRGIRAICAQTPVGYVCRQSKSDEIFAMLDEILTVVENFNDSAEVCSIEYDPIEPTPLRPADPGQLQQYTAHLSRITAAVEEALAGDEAAAVAAAGSTARGGKATEAILAMAPGAERDAMIASCRAATMRKCIKDAKGLEQVFDGDGSREVLDLIDGVRAVAKDLKRRVINNKQGLTAALKEIDTSGFSTLRGRFVAANTEARQSMRSRFATLAGRDPDEETEAPEEAAAGPARAVVASAPATSNESPATDEAESDPQPAEAPAARRAVAASVDKTDEKTAPPAFARGRRIAKKGGGFRLQLPPDDSSEATG